MFTIIQIPVVHIENNMMPLDQIFCVYFTVPRCSGAPLLLAHQGAPQPHKVTGHNNIVT